MSETLQTTEGATPYFKFSIVDGDDEIAYAYLNLVRNSGKGPYGLLEDVFVSEGARGRGLGTKLVQQVIEKAQEVGCHKLLGTSRHTRPHVHAWYLRLGFADWGREFRMDFD